MEKRLNLMKSSEHLQVAYFTSDLYAEPCGVSICSLFENNKNFKNITVYIIDDKISDNNKKFINELADKYNRNIQYIKQPVPQKFFNDERFTIKTLGHTFAHMIVGQLLPKDLDKVLCIDSDMLILDKLDDLWNTNLDGYYIAGCEGAPGSVALEKEMGIDPSHTHCNGGLMFINLYAVRKDNIERKYVSYIKSIFDKGKILAAYEEEVMNKCCYPKVLILPARYNVMTVSVVMGYKEFIKFRGATNFYSEDEFNDAVKNPTIVHALNNFYVRKRYWEENSDSPFADKYLEYRKLTLWNNLPLIKVKRSFKQKVLKEFWHWLPKKVAFCLAAFVRNNIRPKLVSKRDDE